MATTDVEELRGQLSSDDEEELYDAIIDVGKRYVPALTDAVAPFLGHSSAELRGAAAQTLGFHLRSEPHRSALLRLAIDDPDPEVRHHAIFGWSSILADSRDPDAIRLLEAWLRDARAPYAVRASAFWGLLRVTGLPRERWPAARAFRNVDAEVPWELVDEALRHAVPS